MPLVPVSTRQVVQHLVAIPEYSFTHPGRRESAQMMLVVDIYFVMIYPY
ncbi:MAG TPA: hypothetical protein PLP57_00095 [Candidatus Saccharicenans sp.]|nr:hypothetical protein [Candidatus Saccharicenans sp.]HRD01031.1 hypothetical protein [Candidatus Saccharicenans sp.]